MHSRCLDPTSLNCTLHNWVSRVSPPIEISSVCLSRMYVVNAMHNCKASSFKVQGSQMKCSVTSLPEHVPHARPTMPCIPLFPTGRSLLGVIEAVRPHLNSSSVLSATEQVLHSLTTSTSSPPHQSLLSQALLTLLTPHLSLEDAPTNNDAFTCSAPTNLISHNHSLLTELKGDTPVDYPTNWVPSSTLVGESGLQQLLNATVRTSSDALSQAAFYLVCSRLCVSPGSMSVSKWIALEWSSYRGLESGGVTEQPGSGGHMPVHPLTESERGEFCRQLAVVAEKITVKGLSPSFLLKVRDRFLNSPSQSSDSWLSNELLTELLDCSGGEVSITQCSLIGCILLNIADRTLEYFSTTCVPELCSRVESSAVVRGEGRARSLETALFLLTVYLTAIVRVQKTGRGACKHLLYMLYAIL